MCRFSRLQPSAVGGRNRWRQGGGLAKFGRGEGQAGARRGRPRGGGRTVDPQEGVTLELGGVGIARV